MGKRGFHAELRFSCLPAQIDKRAEISVYISCLVKHHCNRIPVFLGPAKTSFPLGTPHISPLLPIFIGEDSRIRETQSCLFEFSEIHRPPSTWPASPGGGLPLRPLHAAWRRLLFFYFCGRATPIVHAGNARSSLFEEKNIEICQKTLFFKKKRTCLCALKNVSSQISKTHLGVAWLWICLSVHCGKLCM